MVECPLCNAVIEDDFQANHYWKAHGGNGCFCGQELNLFNPWYGLSRKDNAWVHFEEAGGLEFHWAETLLPQEDGAVSTH